MNDVKLILLRSDEPHHLALERLLRRQFDLRAVVAEPGAAQTRGWLARKRYRAWLWRRYHALRRAVGGAARFRRKFFAAVSPDADPVSQASPTLTVDSINDPRVAECLRDVAHDWVIVIGTSILKPATLAASPRRFINLHGGCLPDFRGNHCVFHAYLEDRLECLATTIHFVDEGVDTGEILAVCPADLRAAPRFAGPEYFYCAAELTAFGKLVQLLRDSRAGSLRGRVQPAGRAAFRMNSRKPKHELSLFARWFKNGWYGRFHDHPSTG